MQPGWYADPAGLPVLRWFDGRGWTQYWWPLPAAPHAAAKPATEKLATTVLWMLATPGIAVVLTVILAVVFATLLTLAS